MALLGTGIAGLYLKRRRRKAQSGAQVWRQPGSNPLTHFRVRLFPRTSEQQA